MTNMLPKEAMRRVMVKILQQQQKNFPDMNSATENTILTLVDIAQLYLTNLAYSAKRYAELSGRTKANAFDVAESLMEAQLDLTELMMFSQDPANVTSIEQNNPLLGCFTDKVLESQEEPDIYEFVDCPDDLDLSQITFSSTSYPEHTSSEEEPLTSLPSPLSNPEDIFLELFPKPDISNRLEVNLEKPEDSLNSTTEPSNLDALSTTRTPPVEKILDASKPSSNETANIWKALHQRRLQQRQKEISDPPKLPSARHDETYRSSFQEIKRSPDKFPHFSESPFDVGSFAPEPPTGNRATVNHTINSFQTPITKMFQESVLSSFLPKFVVSAPQPLDQEQVSELGQAPLPSWVPPPPAPVPAPVRIVAKLPSPKLIPDKPLNDSPPITRINATVGRPSQTRGRGRGRPRSLSRGPAKGTLAELTAPARHLYKSSTTNSSGFVPKITARVGSKPDYRHSSSHIRSKHASRERSDPSKTAQPSKPLILRIPSTIQSTNVHANGNGNSNRTKLNSNGNPDKNHNANSNGTILHVSSPSLSPPEPDVRIPEPRKGDLLPIQEQPQSYENSNAVTNCVCANFDTDEGFMMECSFCTQWFHGLCVGYSSETETPDPWACPRCKVIPQDLSPVDSPLDNSKEGYGSILPRILSHDRKPKHKKHKHRRKRDSSDSGFDRSHRRIHRTSPYTAERSQRSPRW